MISIVKSIRCQRYKIIQLRLTILLVFWTALLHIQLCSVLAGLAGSRNAVLYAVHAMQLYRVQGLTPPILACAVRVMNLGAETKFKKGTSDRNSRPGWLVLIMSKWRPELSSVLKVYFECLSS